MVRKVESKLAIAKKALRHLDAIRGLIEGNFELSPRVVFGEREDDLYVSLPW